MQSSSEQPLVGEERYVTTLITAAKETSTKPAVHIDTYINFRTPLSHIGDI